MGLLDRYGSGEEVQSQKTTSSVNSEKLTEVVANVDPFEDVKSKIHQNIIEKQLASGVEVTEEGMRQLIDEYVEKSEYGIPRISRDTVKEELFDDIMGYGPIQTLVNSDL